MMRLLASATDIGNYGAKENTMSGSVQEVAMTLIVTWVLPAFAALSMIGVIYAGVLYIMSEGDPEKVKKAHYALLYSIGAIVLVVLSYSIVVGIGNIMKNDILK